MSDSDTRRERGLDVMQTLAGSADAGASLAEYFDSQGALGSIALLTGAGEIWSRPGLETEQPHHRRYEQPAAGEESEGAGDLCSHQGVPQALLATATAHATASKRLPQVETRAAQRWSQAEENARQERNSEGEGQDPCIGRDGLESRQVLRGSGDQGASAEDCNQCSEGAARQRQQHALDHRHPDDVGASGTESRTDGQLSAACGLASEPEIG